MITPLFKTFINYEKEEIGIALHQIVKINLFSGQVDFVGGTQETFSQEDAQRIWSIVQRVEDLVQ